MDQDYITYVRNDPAAFIANCSCGWSHSAPKGEYGSYDSGASDDAVNAHNLIHNPPHVPRPTHLDAE